MFVKCKDVIISKPFTNNKFDIKVEIVDKEVIIWFKVYGLRFKV